METTPTPDPNASESQPAPPERSRAWRIVAIVLSLHAALLGTVVLIQGCGKSETPTLSENDKLPTAETEHDMSTNETPSANSAATLAPGSDIQTPEEQRLPAPSVTVDVPPAGTGSITAAPSSVTASPNAAMPPASGIANGAATRTPGRDSTAASMVHDPVAPVATSSAPAASVAPSTVRYTVKRGDSLSRIAQRNSTSVRQLAAANRISEKAVLKIGQKLVIPSRATTQVARSPSPSTITAPSVEAAAASGGEMRSHIVRPRETPISIARRYGVTVDSLLRANHISNPRKIRVNQKLLIPSPKVARESAPMPEPDGNIEPVSGAGSSSAGHEVKRI